MKRSFLTLVTLPFLFVPLMATGALEFDGINDYVAANSVSTAMSSASYLTLETWVYPADLNGDECLLTFHTSTGANVVLLGVQNRQPYVSQGGTSDFGTALLQNSWSHLAVTLDASTDTAKVYINGVYDFYTIIDDSPNWN